MNTSNFEFKKSWIMIGIAVVLVIWVIGSYNSLVSKQGAIGIQWAQVETDYQRRFDLIPSLAESVKGVLKQEKEVFSAIANARQGYAGARNVNEKVAAANQFDGALSRLLVITENYPELKSNQTMQNFMVSLEGTENRISVERKRYNDVSGDYNISIGRFPGILIAKLFGFDKQVLFAAEKGAEKAPKVNFN